MNPVTLCLQVALLVQLIVSLSIHNQEQLSTDQQYYEALMEKQARLKQDFALIQSEISSIKQTLINSQTDEATQTKILEEGLADERDSLYTIETYLKLPYSSRNCSRNAISDATRQELRAKITQVNNSLILLSNQVQNCNAECSLFEEIKFQIIKEQNYLENLKQIIEACPKQGQLSSQEEPSGLVNLAQSMYKDNLKASNWDLGTMTQAEFKDYIFKQTTQYNLTSCPITHPYVRTGGDGCFQCDGIFDLSTRKCNTCSEGLYFDYKELKCKQQCPEDQYLDQISQTCQQKCKTADNKYYDFQRKSCLWNNTECPSSNQIFNNETGECTQHIVCDADQVYDPISKQCISSIKQTFGICPPTRPVWNPMQIKCDQCPKQKPLYIKEYNRCQACPDKTEWNLSLLKCVIICDEGFQLSQKAQQCIEMCPSQKGLQFNRVTQKCELICKEGEAFDKQSQVCHSICKDSQYYNFTSKTCLTNCSVFGQILNWDTLLCECLVGEQWDELSGECNQIECENGQYYSIEQRSCKQIECPSGYILVKQTSKCYKCPKNYQFDTTLMKCTLLNGTCLPPSYFNTSTHQCQLCPSNSFYNNSLQNCITCPSGSVLSSTTNQCVRKSCPQGYIFDEQMELCYICEPGYQLNKQRKECEIVQCPINESYNLRTRKCEKITCKFNQYIDQELKTCKNIPICSRHGIYSLSVQMCFYPPITCSPNQYYDFTISSCIPIPTCASSQIFNFVTQQCISNPCEAHQYFNQSLQTCLECQIGFYYNTNAGGCISIPVCPSTQYFSPSYQLCLSFPYCKNQQYFDSQSEKCLQKPFCSQGRYFSEFTKKCAEVPNCQVNQFFNQTSEVCQIKPKCPSNYHFNVTLSRCVSNPFCPNEYYYNPETGLCHGYPTCPQGYTYQISDGNCHKIMCENDQFYNLESKKCMQIPVCLETQFFKEEEGRCLQIPNCSDNEYFSSNEKSCVMIPSCPFDEYFQIENQKCVQILQCDQGQYFSLQGKQCKPIPLCDQFFDQQKQLCSRCLLNEYYSLLNNKCQLIPDCKPGFIYNQDTQTCDKADFVTDPSISNIIIGTSYSEFVAENERKITKEGYKVCENPTPYFSLNSGECIGCPSEAPYFNANAGYCQSCGQSRYLEDSHRCQFLGSNLEMAPTLQRLLMNIV